MYVLSHNFLFRIFSIIVSIIVVGLTLASAVDGGPTVNHRLFNVLCLLVFHFTLNQYLNHNVRGLGHIKEKWDS